MLLDKNEDCPQAELKSAAFGYGVHWRRSRGFHQSNPRTSETATAANLGPGLRHRPRSCSLNESGPLRLACCKNKGLSMNKCLAVLVVGLVPGVTVDAATLIPVAVQECVIPPGVPSTVRWKIQSGPIGGIDYVVCDYAEKQVAAGRAKAAGDDVVETILNLPQGFHEIEFPATKQRFGIIVLPENIGKDPFFAIDGGLSWLVRDAAVREGLICVAKRVGMDMIRERLTWARSTPRR